MLVPLKKYADKWNLQPVSVRRRCIRGTITSAVKVGRDWWIDENEKIIDYRQYPYCLDRRYGSKPKKKKAETIKTYTIEN